LIPAARYTGVSVFRADYVTNGSALAQSGDQAGVQCDLFPVSPPQNVDFVLVIDNSGSMSNEQAAVATAASEMGAQLSSSTVDWRVAVITSDLDYQSNDNAAWQRGEHPQATLSITSINDDGTDSGGGNRRIRITTSPASGYVVGDDLFVWGTSNYNNQYSVRTAGNPFETTTGNGTSNTATESSGSVRRAERYCAFTTSTAELSDCVTTLGIRGSGEENFFRAMACALGRSVSGPGITSSLDTAGGELGGSADGESCGRDGDRAPYPSGNTYLTPPGIFSMLPRTDGSATKLRTDARLAVIFITDANDQSDGRYSRLDTGYPGDAIATHSVPAWVSFFQNFDGAGGPLSSAFVAGLVCPNNGDCTDEGNSTPGDEPYMNPRFQQLFSSLGGIEAQLPDDTDPAQAQKIGDAIRSILQQAIGAASPYTLTKPPISSTIKVAMEHNSTVGPCNWDDVPRDTQNGFDYDPISHAIVFYGDCRPDPDRTGARVSVSYRYWIDQSPEPDPQQGPCGICAYCPGISRCDLEACACICEQTVSCNPGFSWNQTACDCLCDTGALSCGPTRTPEDSLCACVCLPDCGGCGANFNCQPSYCECVPRGG
ncbi:MAG: VWA domain-containing protein, partial [Proteobacteria bacterium]|nr:VWA domain-containing protein [Pseudomonadota bacterium]